MCLENTILKITIKHLDNFNLKLLFRVQMTKKDLTILLSYLGNFSNVVNVANCNNNK